jgi:hypothetical protein
MTDLDLEMQCIAPRELGVGKPTRVMSISKQVC